ncbi:hypothetical protein [Thiobacillus sp. 65-1402]|uniref:hypothetical protein n=1 Tax=Thiobacillus sp. 65-1402 TaxID=1895861 RepID=UPI0025DE63CA|nr:hypothetical protein [Thiobacillus sp. 65-1402]
MITTDLLDAVMKKTGATSDYKLAQVLDFTKQKVSDLRAGRNKPDPYECAKIAEVLDRDPLEVIAQVEAKAARSEKKREYWRRFFSGMKRRAHVAVLSVTCGFFAGALPGGHAEAGPVATSHNVYYVK